MRAIAVASLLLVLAACGSGSTSTTSATSAPTSSTTEAAITSTSGSPGSTTAVSVPVTHPTAHLVAVRAARQDGFDRVVFEFSERVPGYKVAWTAKPLMTTSGKEVTLAGTSALLVRMEQASGFDLDKGKPTYTGAKSVQPLGTDQVQEVAQVEDFEAVLSWGLGAKAEVPFKVSTLSSPPRLVVDLLS